MILSWNVWRGVLLLVTFAAEFVTDALIPDSNTTAGDEQHSLHPSIHHAIALTAMWQMSSQSDYLSLFSKCYSGGFGCNDMTMWQEGAWFSEFVFIADCGLFLLQWSDVCELAT